MFQGVVLRAHICPKAGTPKPCFPKMKAPNSSVVGGCLRTDCTAASTDGDFIFVSSDSAVRMYGARTGDRVLDLHGHAAEVTAICVDPANKQQVRSRNNLNHISVYAVMQVLRNGVLVRASDGRALSM